MQRNRIEKEERQLKGVNLAPDVTKLQLGMFTRLENWVPGKITSIKKKRGVRCLDNECGPTLEMHGPFFDCSFCDPAAPGALTGFHHDIEFVGTASSHGSSWGRVGPDGTIFVLRTDSGTGGGNAPYNDPSTKLLKIDGQTNAITEIAKIAPVELIPAVNTSIGHSDEDSYLFSDNASFHYYYSVNRNQRTRFSAVVGSQNSGGWDRRGGRMFILGRTLSTRVLAEYLDSGGADTLQPVQRSFDMTAISTGLSGVQYLPDNNSVYVGDNSPGVVRRVPVSTFNSVAETITLGVTLIDAFWVLSPTVIYFYKRAAALADIELFRWTSGITVKLATVTFPSKIGAGVRENILKAANCRFYEGCSRTDSLETINIHFTSEYKN